MTEHNVWLEIELEIVNAVDIEVELETCYQSGGGGVLPFYEGPYDAIPKVIQQTLKTKNKSMSKDVIIEKIPFEEVHNETGVTVTIGGIL